MNNTLRKYLYSFLLLLAALIASNSALGQDLTIHPTFNNMYGAGSFEDLYASFETSDGGFILGGKAFQNATTGNINDPFCGTNNSDYWIVKTDIDGNTEWDTLFGGTANEELYDMIETSDGGYALVGRSTSPASCDVPAGNPFVYDAWVVKIDALGNILWTSRFGSAQGDNAKSIIETSDGGLLIGGDTMNVVDNAPDYWITKLDGTTGAVLWDNSIGGDDYDFLEVVRETTDGFFLGGYSISGASKDKTTANFGSWDYWVVKVDLSGNYVWDISYGGSGNDQLWDMEVTSDGGLIIGGFSDSDPSILPNNKTAANIGLEDCWAIKVNSAGAITWDRSYGGVDLDRIYSVEVVELSDCVTNYIFGGITNSSASGDVADPNLGGGDYWINFVDASGSLIWEKNYGGDQYEEIRDFRRNSDGSYIVGGYTISDNNGDVPSTNYGIFDNWAFKLSCNFDIPDLADEEVCEGESITLTAVSGICLNCTYQWDANGGNATTNSISVSPTDTTTYTVIVTNSTCCPDTTSATVIWHPSPTVDLGPDTEICPGENIPLDATTPTCTYAWSTGATTPTINPTMAGTYSVTITCEFGCTATDEIVINPGIVPTVDLGNNTTLCAGDSILLDAGAGGMDYDWSTGAISQMIYGKDETDYCVTVTSVDGCTTVDCISINYDTIQVVLPNDTMLCPSETLVVSAGNIGCAYNWSNGLMSQSITISTAGTYTVTVTCGPASCTAVDEIVVGYFSENSPQNVVEEICQGDSLFVGGAWQFFAGNYSDTYLTADGCDSIVNTNLMVHSVFSQNVPMEICQGDSIFVGGDWQFSNGSYSDTLMTVDGCDSIIITDLEIRPTFSINVPIEICQGETYFAQGAAQNMMGTYFDTLMTVDGCDSIIITDLVVNPTFSQNVSVEICQGESYFAGGAAQTMTGSYPDTLMTIDGCDSIIITDLVVNPIFSQNVDAEICQGDSIFLGNDWQFTSGFYSDTLMTVFGCDSIFVTNLEIRSTFSQNVSAEICQGDSLFVGGNWQFLNGSYSDTLMTIFGCDSIIITDLEIRPTFSINVPIEICQGETYFAQGAAQNMMGTYFDTLMTVDGCDSIIITDLIVNPIYSQNVPVEICQGESYFAGGAAQTMMGSYPDTLMTVDGCDSIIITDLVVNPVFSQNIDAEICQGDSIFLGNDWQFMAGFYSDTLMTVFGCDSIFVTNLEIRSTFSQNVPVEICQGDSIFLENEWQFFAGSYSDTLITVFGCDSIIITDLIVNPIFSTNVPIEICQGETYFAQGAAQNMTGTYFDTLMTVEGCDSIIITDLIVNPTFSQNVSVEICQGESYFAGGAAQTMMGSYPDTLMTVDGCDSIIITDLVVNPVFSQNIDAEICQGDSIFLENDWQFMAGFYSDTLMTVFGCDSVIITNLEIRSTFSQNVSAEICQGDSLFVGGDWQFSNGSYSDTLMTVDGCDSIIITALVVNPIFSTNVPIEICQGETYFVQGAAQNLTGTYFDTLMTVNGCDSIIITDLIVNPTFSQNVPVEICQGESYFAGGAAQTMTGSYPDTLVTIGGCDSVIITDLVVNSTFIQNIPAEICEGDSIFVGGNWQTISGSYLDNYLTINNCDSIVITDLIVHPIFSQNIPLEICQGDSTFVGGSWQINPGSYFDTLMTVNGCDSIIITDLVVNDTFEIMVDTMICNSALVGLDTINLFSQNGCDSNVIYNFMLIDIDTFTFEEFTCDSNLVDTLVTDASGMNGECDSILVYITSLAPSYEFNIDTTTCNASQVGLDTVFMSSVFGCDSNLIYDYQLIDADSFFFQNFTCDANLVDTTFTNATGLNGECDSILVNIISLAPSYEIYIDTTTCIASQVGLDTVFMSSVFGCDSNLIYDYQLIDADSFFFQNFTCDSNLVDTTFSNATGMNGECDSILVNIISLAPSYEINIDTTTCIASQVGLDTIFMSSVFGCDSNLIYDYQLIDADSFFFQNFTCDSNLVDTTFENATGMNGECDSVLVNIISLAPSYEFKIDTTTCIASQVGLDTIFMSSVFGCDSNLIYDYQLIDADSFFFQNFTCDSNLVDTTFTNATGMNGECDSILVNIISLAPSYEINIDTTTCIASQVGLDTIFMSSVFGCDSNLIYNYQLIDADSFFFQNFTCDSNLVDTTFSNATGVNGECDSILVNIISLAPSYEINIDTTTCIASQVGVDTVFMNSVFGCDSNLIYNYQLINADSFFFQNFTCDSNLVDTTFENATGVNGECDSILVNIISLAPSYEVNIDTTTCIASQVGLDTVYLMSQFGCDSTVIFNYELLAADTFMLSETSCDSTLLGTTIMNLPGMNGECDSILIINTTFACDTIYINSTSCNPLDTGIFIQLNGSNTIIDSVSLAPTDSTYLTDNSCNPLDTGLMLSSTLQNIYGCDSLIFTYTTLLPSQNILIESMTCDVSQTGIFVDTLQNQFGCDSIVTNSISLLPSSIDTILTLSCFIDDVGTDTIFVGTNSLGCDSLVVAITAYEQVIEAFVSFSDISCFGESDGVILVDSVLGGTPPYLYSIDNMPFQSTPIFTNLSADNYTILIEDADGCQTLAVVPLNSINEIIVDLGEDLFINIGDSVTIFAQINIDAEELDTIIWTTVDSINCSGNCLDFTVTPFQTTTYSIMILDENGCSSQDEITVVVDENIPVYIPNAFSPNEDNYNDKITIFGNFELIEEVQFFRIFDRWGELVYHAESFQPNDPDNGWDGNLDGQPMNPAVFVYFAEVRFIDGSIKQFKGDITLVR